MASVKLSCLQEATDQVLASILLALYLVFIDWCDRERSLCRYSFVKYGGVDQGMRCCTNMIGVIPTWLQNGSVCNLGLSAMHYIIVATLSIATVHLMVSDQ